MNAKTGHHLERRRAGAFVDNDAAPEAGLDDVLAGDEVKVQKVIMLLL
jgi:hypothetical protein